MEPSNAAEPIVADESNNAAGEVSSMEAVRLLWLQMRSKRGRVSVMSSDTEDENVESGGRQSEPYAQWSTVSIGLTGRAVEEALKESQLSSLVPACSDPALLPELLCEVSFLHLRPDEYLVFLEHVANFHGRADALTVPASVMRDLSKFLRGLFCKYLVTLIFRLGG